MPSSLVRIIWPPAWREPANGIRVRTIGVSGGER